MKIKCEICHEYDSVLTCEGCGARVCNLCCDVVENDPEDLDTWAILCDDCLSKLENGEYMEYPSISNICTSRGDDAIDEWLERHIEF